MSHHYRCAGCEKGQCCNNAGTVTVMDQDGSSRYVCGCGCAERVRRRHAEDSEIRAFIRRFGAVRVREALDA